MFSVRHKASMSSRPRRRCDQLPPCVCERRSNKPCWIFEKTMLCIVENRGTSPQGAGEKYFLGGSFEQPGYGSSDCPCVCVYVFTASSSRLSSPTVFGPTLSAQEAPHSPHYLLQRGLHARHIWEYPTHLLSHSGRLLRNAKEYITHAVTQLTAYFTHFVTRRSTPPTPALSLQLILLRF